MSVGQAKNLLAGQPGTGVKVGVIRRGKTDPEKSRWSREKLSAPKLIAQRIDNETMAFRFPTLDAGRADEVRARLQEAQQAGRQPSHPGLRECGRGSIPEASPSRACSFLPANSRLSARPDRSRASFCRRCQQGRLERPRFHSDGRHDHRRRRKFLPPPLPIPSAAIWSATAPLDSLPSKSSSPWTTARPFSSPSPTTTTPTANPFSKKASLPRKSCAPLPPAADDGDDGDDVTTTVPARPRTHHSVLVLSLPMILFFARPWNC